MPISSDFPFESKFVEVLGSDMHYVEEGEGDPILFLHGNPTSSYLWRNVIPYAVPHGRAIAVDLIGMGKSGKPDIPYRFADHVRYLDAFIGALGLENITLVIHDWGSGLGFHYAHRNPSNVKGIAFMEAVLQPLNWADAPLPMRMLFKRMRAIKTGNRMNLEKNFFVKRLMPFMVKRRLTPVEKAHYAAPYPDAASRMPVAQWPREVPFDGDPADNYESIVGYWEWLQETDVPLLMLYAKPGMIIDKKLAAELIAAIPSMESVYVGKSRHYIQEDVPDAIGEALASWLERASSS